MNARNKISTANALKSLSNERKLKEYPYKDLIEQLRYRVDEGLRTCSSNDCPEPFNLFDENELEEYKKIVELYLESHEKIKSCLDEFKRVQDKA